MQGTLLSAPSGQQVGQLQEYLLTGSASVAGAGEGLYVRRDGSACRREDRGAEAAVTARGRDTGQCTVQWS
jgi:hypothetical protein